MQPFISQALSATRIAEMHRETQIALRVRDPSCTRAIQVCHQDRRNKP